MSDLYEVWLNAKLKVAEADVKEMKASKAYNAAIDAARKAQDAEDKAFKAWQCSKNRGDGHAE